MDVPKDRSASSDSVTEYVNKVFLESELELSKVESIDVSALNDNLQNLAASDSVSTVPHPTGFRKMYAAALLVLLFAVNMGFTATYSATATVDMQRPHSSIHPNSDEVTWIGSLMAVGALIGGTAAGYLTSAFGRKGALILNTVPYVIGWILIMYAKSTGMIYAGRIVTGFCCGVVSVATPLYLVEISSPEVRGLLGASFQLFVVIGVLIVSMMGSVLTWRDLAMSGAFLSVAAALFMIPMPESPRWLMNQKQKLESKRAVQFLHGKFLDVENECIQMESENDQQSNGQIRLSELADPLVYKPFVLSVLLMFFQQFSGVNAVLFYTVQIFQTARSTLQPTLANILVSVVQVIATMVSSLLMDRAGRKPLLLFSGSGMALSLLVFGGFDFAQSRNPSVVDSFGWLPIVCLMSFIASFAIGFGPTPWLMVAEMTPSRFRSLVSGISTGLNWTFVFIVTKTFQISVSYLHGYGVYWMYGAFCILSLFFTYFLLPETKGKSAEEIQKHFKKTTVDEIDL